jgi:hypothetical protein
MLAPVARSFIRRSAAKHHGTRRRREAVPVLSRHTAACNGCRCDLLFGPTYWSRARPNRTDGVRAYLMAVDHIHVTAFRGWALSSTLIGACFHALAFSTGSRHNCFVTTTTSGTCDSYRVVYKKILVASYMWTRQKEICRCLVCVHNGSSVVTSCVHTSQHGLCMPIKICCSDKLRTLAWYGPSFESFR